MLLTKVASALDVLLLQAVTTARLPVKQAIPLNVWQNLLSDHPWKSFTEMNTNYDEGATTHTATQSRGPLDSHLQI